MIVIPSGQTEGSGKVRLLGTSQSTKDLTFVTVLTGTSHGTIGRIAAIITIRPSAPPA